MSNHDWGGLWAPGEPCMVTVWRQGGDGKWGREGLDGRASTVTTHGIKLIQHREALH